MFGSADKDTIAYQAKVIAVQEKQVVFLSKLTLEFDKKKEELAPYIRDLKSECQRLEEKLIDVQVKQMKQTADIGDKVEYCGAFYWVQRFHLGSMRLYPDLSPDIDVSNLSPEVVYLEQMPLIKKVKIK